MICTMQGKHFPDISQSRFFVHGIWLSGRKTKVCGYPGSELFFLASSANFGITNTVT